MKNLKLIFLGLGCMAALSLTSCLKDDDNNNNGLSQAQIAQCVNAVRGSYTGKLVYYKTSTDFDTVDVSWSIGADTMLVINAFPAKAFAEIVSDNDLKNALMESNTHGELKCYLGFYQYDTQVQFLLAPLQVDFPVFYKDATHTLSLYFWTDSYSSGYKDTSSGAMEAMLVMAAAYLDNNENKNYLNGMSQTLASIPLKITTLIK
ncbi:MAG: DUF4840 domain-containing protein [Prevotella sp.]|nr:DUF4840 domain-containing protein [Prevotella sp.]